MSHENFVSPLCCLVSVLMIPLAPVSTCKMEPSAAAEAGTRRRPLLTFAWYVRHVIVAGSRCMNDISGKSRLLGVDRKNSLHKICDLCQEKKIWGANKVNTNSYVRLRSGTKIVSSFPAIFECAFGHLSGKNCSETVQWSSLHHM